MKIKTPCTLEVLLSNRCGRWQTRETGCEGLGAEKTSDREAGAKEAWWHWGGYWSGGVMRRGGGWAKTLTGNYVNEGSGQDAK